MENASYEQHSRKRPLDAENDGYNTYKRSNVASGKPTLKFLVPNFMAGKLIGKGGSNIGELQSKFNASIQISPNKEFYPGTSDRIVSISADINQIIEFNNYLIAEVEEEEKSDRNNPSLKQEVKLVVSNVAAGLVIGKGGASIKAIQAESNGARINISKKEESITGERVLVVSGDGLARASACKQIIEIMASEPDKMSNGNLKYGAFNNPMGMPQNNLNLPVYNHIQGDPSANYMHNSVASVVSNAMSSVGNHGNAWDMGNSNYPAKSGVRAKFQCEMEVPEKMVGVILGRQGQTISEFSRSTGAKLQFSGKDEYAPNTTNRILTITGGMYQVQNAYILVDKRLAQMEAEFNRPFARQ